MGGSGLWNIWDFLRDWRSGPPWSSTPSQIWHQYQLFPSRLSVMIHVGLTVFPSFLLLPSFFLHLSSPMEVLGWAGHLSCKDFWSYNGFWLSRSTHHILFNLLLWYQSRCHLFTRLYEPVSVHFPSSQKHVLSLQFHITASMGTVRSFSCNRYNVTYSVVLTSSNNVLISTKTKWKNSLSHCFRICSNSQWFTELIKWVLYLSALCWMLIFTSLWMGTRQKEVNGAL